MAVTPVAVSTLSTTSALPIPMAAAKPPRGPYAMPCDMTKAIFGPGDKNSVSTASKKSKNVAKSIMASYVEL